MERTSAGDTKNGCDKLIDLARAEPVAIETYGRSVAIVMAVEEYEHLSGNTERQRSVAIPEKGKGAKT